jgi:hypothetical protein
MSDTLVVVVAGVPPWSLSLIAGGVLGVFVALVLVSLFWDRSR